MLQSLATVVLGVTFLSAVEGGGQPTPADNLPSDPQPSVIDHGEVDDQPSSSEPPVEEQAEAPTEADIAKVAAALRAAEGQKPDDFPKWEEVSKDYQKVVSTADGEASLYTVYTRAKDAQVLAELPRDFERQRLFLAYTIAGGTPTAGVQTGDLYVYWKRFDKQLALIQPNIAVRTSGDFESNRGKNRVFTDRVVLAVPIACMGPNGGPVVDMDALLVGQSQTFFGWATAGANANLSRIAKAKAYPQNVELSFELPLSGGRLGTISYSIAVLPENTGYQPRKADERIGYFTTTYMDVGKPSADTPWVRYINRWKLEKADANLKMSPPKEPIVFYLENTIPVRYRRWVREGVLEWNKAFALVGISNAIEVYQQDARTGAHMDKDPEDARYNFILWTNANMGFAIGPSRVDPRTGQIIDADVVMDEGFVTAYAQAWKKVIPQIAMQNFTPETYAWLAKNPQWDPRVMLAAPAEREAVRNQLAQQYAQRGVQRFGGHPAAAADATLMGDDQYDGLTGNVSQQNGMCMAGAAKSLDVALFRIDPNLIADLVAGVSDEDASLDQDPGAVDENGQPRRRRGMGGRGNRGPGAGGPPSGDRPEGMRRGDEPGKPDAPADSGEKDPPGVLDGMPEEFIGPLIKDVIMHEVGHVLGLRHNFKASSIHTQAEINTAEFKGKAQTASVMDYNPINVNVNDGPVQGDWCMMTIGPYDYWAIEYGYTMEKDLKPVLAKVSQKDLPYGTDEDTWGPDPLSRRFDYTANPLDYADSQVRLVQQLRPGILDRMVKDGESWAKAREGYEILLYRQFSAAGIASSFIGGSYVNRDRKGDPPPASGPRDPITPVEVEQQRRALKIIIDNIFRDEAFGLTPELLNKMTVDKWYDEGGMGAIFEDPTWPVHDRIMGLQATALTMILNPTTLDRVYDSEFRVNAGGGEVDALSLPEVIDTVSVAIWSELDANANAGGGGGGQFTAGKPMISSLRRNLQREYLDRMIALTLPGGGYGASARAVTNLCAFQLRQLSDKIAGQLKNSSKLDPYTLAHLTEANVRITKALDAQYIYNAGGLGGGGMPMIYFREGEEPSPLTPSKP
jgi:hypothetical protein